MLCNQDNPCVYYCSSCRYFRRNVKKPSHRCSICMDSTFSAKVHNPALRGKPITPLYYEEKRRKKDIYGQLYFRFI